MVSFIQVSLPKLCMNFSSPHMCHLENIQFHFKSLIEKWLHKCLDPREVKWTLIYVWIKWTCLHFLMLMDELTKNVKVTVLWDVTACSLVGKNPRFRWTCCILPLYLTGSSASHYPSAKLQGFTSLNAAICTFSAVTVSGLMNNFS